MATPQLRADASAPSAFDDRSTADVAIDTAAAGVKGALLAYEAEFGGQMAITLEILSRAVNDFLDDVEESAGSKTALAYAAHLVREIEAR